MAGLPCVLLRLAGCPLRCTWCDTTFAREGGQAMSLEEVLAQVARLGPGRVLVTGGEPLAQAECLLLLSALLEAGYECILETSGAFDIAGVPPGVRRIVDVKPPSSGEQGRMLAANLELLGAGDEVKFLIADRVDFDAALAVVGAHKLEQRAALLLSPVQGRLAPATLGRWILESGVDARLNIQLHKLAFGVEGDAALRPDAGDAQDPSSPSRS